MKEVRNFEYKDRIGIWIGNLFNEQFIINIDLTIQARFETYGHK